MTRYDRRVRLLATILAGVAGYVDATGFLALHGFFVSFMSGNTTRLSVGLAKAGPDAATAAVLILTFVAGVIAGSLLGHAAGRHRRPAVLLLVALLLSVAATSHASAMAMGLAMGAENAVFEQDGDIHIGLTYMTGTLVKFGQRLARSLRGGSPRLETVPYLLMWLGMVAGAVAGALEFPRLGVASLWIPAALAAVIALAFTTPTFAVTGASAPHAPSVR